MNHRIYWILFAYLDLIHKSFGFVGPITRIKMGKQGHGKLSEGIHQKIKASKQKNQARILDYYGPASQDDASASNGSTIASLTGRTLTITDDVDAQPRSNRNNFVKTYALEPIY